jgi:hypothetical protein
MDIKKAIGVGVGTLAMLMGTIGSANASTHNSSDHSGTTGRCSSTNGGACLYYGSGESGAKFQMHQPIFISDLAGKTYDSSGSGAGQAVKNNSASAENVLGYGCVLYVYYNSNYGGNVDYVNPETYGQLWYTYNEDASVQDGCP